MKSVTIEISEDVAEILKMYCLHSGCKSEDDAILDAIKDSTSAQGSEEIFGNLSFLATVLIDSRKDSKE